ncbi:unnamed protein product [Schistosoma rodhaini]|uniref:Uncharacterized protein n=2 Tax=Schistosoma rodhaini TaxID=6188 RepID=A0AA85F605_9TREM|nr:unnamed protein product [Schistosoma rodhaini]
MALDNIPLLLTQSFLDLRDECYSLMGKRFSNNNRLPKNTTIYAYAKLFAQFCLLSEELERWLKRVCKLAFEGRLAYVSRSEAYMNQNYLGCINNRDVDLNRLRSLANQLLVMSGKTSDSATVISAESPEDFLGVSISNRLQEIETMWNDITNLVQPMSLFHDPSRTIRDVELDVQETEAKLCSISRRTFDLQTVLTKSIRGTCSLNSDMSVLEAEHISLKRSMQTLSAAGWLLSQLQMFSVENNPHLYGGETFDFLICKLTENIDKLTHRGWSLWFMHLELLERWKYLSKSRSSFENLNVEVNNRTDYSTSSVYSLCCSESGFASDADQFLTCQSTDQFESKNRKSFSSVNDNIRSQSSDCLWTSNTDSNDSEAISDSPSGLFHGIYDRTPTKLVSSSTERNGKSDDNDNDKTNKYKYFAKQSKYPFDICFEQTNSLEYFNRNNLKMHVADNHDLGFVYSRFHSSDSGLKRKCSSANRIRLTSWSGEDIFKMPVGIFSSKDHKRHQFIATCGVLPPGTLAGPKQYNYRKLRRNSFTSLLSCIDNHSDPNAVDLRETTNHNLNGTSCSELLPTTEFESNSYRSSSQQSPDLLSIIIPPNNLNNNNSKNVKNNAEHVEILKNSNHVHKDNGLMYGIHVHFDEKLPNIHRDDDNADGLEWDDLGDLQIAKSDSPSLLPSNESVDTLNGSIVNTGGSILPGSPLTLAAEALVSPCFQLTESHIQHLSQVGISQQKSHAEVSSLYPSHHSEISILINNLSVSQNNSYYSPESVKSWEKNFEVQKCESSCAKIELHTPHPDTIVNHNEAYHYNRGNNNHTKLEAASVTDLPDSSLVNEPDILPLLTSIRRDALPLTKLLLRLEEKSVTGLLDSDLQVDENLYSQKLKDERRQLDIDKSYLTHYGKRLTQWTNTMDKLLDSLPHEEADYKTQLQTSLSIALNTFGDWLSALKARHTMALWVVNWRSSMFDHLVGESYDANVSLLGMKQRVQTAIHRAQEVLKQLLQSYDEFTSSTDSIDHCLNEIHSDLGVISTYSSNEFLNTLEELRDLHENLWTIQSRLGSCYLFNDFWKFSCKSNIIVQHDCHNPFDHYGKELNVNISKCSIANLIHFSCELRHKILTMIRDLESAIIKQSNAIIVKTKRLSIYHAKQQLIDSHIPFTVEKDKEVTDNVISSNDSVQVDNYDLHTAVGHLHSRSFLCLLYHTLFSQTYSNSLPHFIISIDKRSFGRCFLIFLLIFIVFVLFESFFGERSITSLMSLGNGCRSDGPVVELSTNHLVKYFTCFQLPNSNNVIW